MKIIRANATFLWLYSLFFLAVGVGQILYRQDIIILAINQYHHPLADVFFKYVTYLGDGIFCIGLGLVCLYWSKRRGIALIASYIFSGLIAQLIKNFIFPSQPRPAQYFEHSMAKIHTVAGVDLAHWHSFPSGHTTSAFALFGLLAFFTQNQRLKIVYLLLAVAVGYSRMYLFQHFLVDVTVGSLLGLMVAWPIAVAEQSDCIK
jgi:membrane-associated phospholipid phosphatase